MKGSLKTGYDLVLLIYPRPAADAPAGAGSSGAVPAGKARPETAPNRAARAGTAPDRKAPPEPGLRAGPPAEPDLAESAQRLKTLFRKAGIG